MAAKKIRKFAVKKVLGYVVIPGQGTVIGASGLSEDNDGKMTD